MVEELNKKLIPPYWWSKQVIEQLVKACIYFEMFEKKKVGCYGSVVGDTKRDLMDYLMDKHE